MTVDEGADPARTRPALRRAVAGLLLWAIAMLYSFFRPDLWILDLVVVPAMWIAAVAGLLLIGAALAAAAHDVRRGRPRAVPGTIGLTVIAATTIVVTATIGAWWPAAPQAWFTTHRALYQQGLDTDPGDDYYGAPLPLHLRFLSASGKVSGDADGARFFPQWIGIPDDAGGYWYSPGRSPQGYDMYGLICTEPKPLGSDWWMCGLRG